MPVIKSAIKKLRQDKAREKQNALLSKKLKDAVRKAAREKSEKSIKKAVSLADRATKKNIIHKNKAARLKSSLAKLAKSSTSGSKTITKTRKNPKKKKNKR